jgi:ferredoxin-NADP reductase
MPTDMNYQLIYALLAGLLFTSQLRIGSVSTTPELVLIIANIFSFIVSPKQTLIMSLKSIQNVAPLTYKLSFSLDNNVSFHPGQYLTLTLDHPHSDIRGTRRTFSIASKPGVSKVSIAIKKPAIGRVSTFKKALLSLKEGDKITASSIAGTFTLPENVNQKLAFFAGGIGITPYLSMLESITSSEENRDSLLVYFVKDEAEICFKDTINQASKAGVKFIPVFNEPGRQGSLTGHLTSEDIKKAIPDCKERIFYISGPPGFVDAYKTVLIQANVPRRQIRTDHFAGY